MSAPNAASRRLPKAAWVVAYLVSPAAPFICLRVERAVSTVHCLFGILAALMVHVGLVSVLVRTNGNPLQFFVVLLLGVSLYLVVAWQYFLGRSASLWSPEAERQWRLAGRLFGVALVVALGLGIVSFHLETDTTKAGHGVPPNASSVSPLLPSVS